MEKHDPEAQLEATASGLETQADQLGDRIDDARDKWERTQQDEFVASGERPGEGEAADEEPPPEVQSPGGGEQPGPA